MNTLVKIEVFRIFNTYVNVIDELVKRVTSYFLARDVVNRYSFEF